MIPLPVIIPAVLAAATGWYAAVAQVRGARHAKTPSVAELWERQDLDARARRRAEEALAGLLRAFLGYAGRTGGPDLTDDERRAVNAAEGALR